VATQNEQSDFKNMAADFIEKFLDLSQYNGDLEIDEINSHPTIRVISDEKDSDILDLVGRNGSIIRALEQLCSLTIRNKTDQDCHVHLDIANYKQKITDKFVLQAKAAIDEVKEKGVPINLRPMNSYNRRIVHRLIHEAGLGSESQGIEPDRYIIVLPVQ
jgi:spoIIIJ-associated protein